MILVCYHPEQDAIRFYYTQFEKWGDMLSIDSKASLAMLISYGWEVIGEL